MSRLIDEKKLEDMGRWHYLEGGLDNRHNVIGELITTLSVALKVVRAAQRIDIEAKNNCDDSNEILDLRESLAPFECDENNGACQCGKYHESFEEKEKE